jgi:hypothetical protein
MGFTIYLLALRNRSPALNAAARTEADSQTGFYGWLAIFATSPHWRPSRRCALSRLFGASISSGKRCLESRLADHSTLARHARFTSDAVMWRLQAPTTKGLRKMRALLLASATVATLVGGMGFAQTALAQQPAGSFQQSCRNTSVQNGVLTSECADTRGQYRGTSIPYTQCRGDISNNNGVLSCNGATANTAPNNGGYRGGNRGDDRGSIQLYAPGYSYPTYGDRRYGDPQFDPRFAQGGYAYGRHANQWVPIADRARWLEQRIIRGQQEGTVDRREARSLRGELNGILSLERRYRREGMNPRKYSDLDRRFDQLAARIQYERTDGDYNRVQR